MRAVREPWEGPEGIAREIEDGAQIDHLLSRIADLEAREVQESKPNYLTASGVARLLGVSRQAIQQSKQLPDHIATVDGRPVWLAEQFHIPPT